MAAGKKRPWKCCDQAVCTRSIRRSAPAWTRSSVPQNLQVLRAVHGRPVPPDLPGSVRQRPWAHLPAVGVLRQGYLHQVQPPTCRCVDEVKKCAPTCKTCLPSRSRPSVASASTATLGPSALCTPREDVATGGNWVPHARARWSPDQRPAVECPPALLQHQQRVRIK
ncbi:hypothetical protein ZWY2020_025282 [Hordeum vulgare]|nr:hypothetical protein ZWY2020_025282 [Hordeum vulgare]